MLFEPRFTIMQLKWEAKFKLKLQVGNVYNWLLQTKTPKARVLLSDIYFQNITLTRNLLEWADGEKEEWIYFQFNGQIRKYSARDIFHSFITFLLSSKVTQASLHARLLFTL